MRAGEKDRCNERLGKGHQVSESWIKSPCYALVSLLVAVRGDRTM